jgi:parallel beta-helix repeat protein
MPCGKSIVFSSPRPIVIHQHIRSLLLACLSLVFLFLLTASAHAATYYVSTSGDDGVSCGSAQNINTPKQTFDGGIGCLAGGDRLEFKAGTYQGPTLAVPSGSSWSSATTFTHYQNDVVTIIVSGGCFLYGPCTAQSYVIVDGFIFDGGAGAIRVDHVRYINNEFKNSSSHGIPAFGCSFCEFINNKVHDNGSTPTYDHGIYISGDNNLIDGNEFYRNAAYGIQVYPDGNNFIIRNNLIHDNARAGESGSGIVLYGSGHQVYNNVIWGNNGGISARRDSMAIYNNTIYANQDFGIEVTGFP